MKKYKRNEHNNIQNIHSTKIKNNQGPNINFWLGPEHKIHIARGFEVVAELVPIYLQEQ